MPPRADRLARSTLQAARCLRQGMSTGGSSDREASPAMHPPEASAPSQAASTAPGAGICCRVKQEKIRAAGCNSGASCVASPVCMRRLERLL